MVAGQQITEKTKVFEFEDNAVDLSLFALTADNFRVPYGLTWFRVNLKPLL